jgi:hypothetical protein
MRRCDLIKTAGDKDRSVARSGTSAPGPDCRPLRFKVVREYQIAYAPARSRHCTRRVGNSWISSCEWPIVASTRPSIAGAIRRSSQIRWALVDERKSNLLEEESGPRPSGSRTRPSKNRIEGDVSRERSPFLHLCRIQIRNARSTFPELAPVPRALRGRHPFQLFRSPSSGSWNRRPLHHLQAHHH